MCRRWSSASGASRGRRHARVGVVAALVLSLSGAVAGPVVASDRDDLENRRQDVTSRIGGAKADLDESSAALLRSARALAVAQRKLTTAQQNLGRTRGELAVAKARDATLAKKLVVAQASLVAAKAALKKGRKDVRSSRRSVERFALESMQDGSLGLRAFGELLDGADPMQFSEQMSINESVSDAQTATLDGYDASRVLLTLNEAKVAKLRDQVAAQRAAAAQNLEDKQRLEAAAEEQTTQVAGLVSTTSGAKQAAESAKRDDLAQLRGLESERVRIGDRLKALAIQEARAEARAAEARARARALALAKARAAARAKARTTGKPVAPVIPPKVEAASSASDGGALSAPANGPITSSYGMRLHPVLNIWKLHDGTDFGIPCGTPVYAAAAGTVIDRYYNAGYGNRVIINHHRMRGVSVATTYNHLSQFVVGVGQQVQRGQLIAYSGTTGYSTGCHLHFMVLVNGSTVDPMSWL